MRLVLLDTFCLLVSWRLYGVLTCGRPVSVFPKSGCKFGFYPFMGVVLCFHEQVDMFFVSLLCFLP